MPNNYFQFKKFRVEQENSAMKVCTDSCLFGAWVENLIQVDKINPKNILDIGTGTGLLSLILAQKLESSIDSIDIDDKSCDEAAKNFTSSTWSERLQVFNADINEWQPSREYDLIICNPPFYENDLLPEDNAKTISKHGSKLRLEDLLIKVKSMLALEGYFAILIPYHRAEWFVKVARIYSLYVTYRLDVKQTSNHSFFRSMFILVQNEKKEIKDEMAIKDNGNEYTKEFSNLLKDYYLHL